MVWKTALILLAIAPAESVTALGNVKSCFVEKAEMYDDGTSDALTIGRVLINACDDRIVAYATAASAHEKRPDRVRKYLLELLRSDAETPAAIVLRLRAARRER